MTKFFGVFRFFHDQTQTADAKANPFTKMNRSPVGLRIQRDPAGDRLFFLYILYIVLLRRCEIQLFAGEMWAFYVKGKPFTLKKKRPAQILNRENRKNRQKSMHKVVDN